MALPKRADASPLLTTLALALAAAVSLGLARFSYALLLPGMRSDLGWSYFTAGALNTANAAGYLAGALLMPTLLRRFDARRLMLAGGAASALLLAAHGLVRSEWLLYALRACNGLASAASFVAGGLLAARWASRMAEPGDASGLRPTHVLGVYYGGAGLGVIAATLAVPQLAWPAAWAALGALALCATAVTALYTAHLGAPPLPGAARQSAGWRPLAWALAGYLMFGLGYIGYMTFVITLLREQGLSSAMVQGFYLLLGTAVVASPFVWSGLMQRWRGGQLLALLNALLAGATLLPVLSAHPLAVLASGALFGAAFLALVASTTALVRHNLPVTAWPAGIAAFTVVFAVGQIVGPSLVGWLADSSGGGLRQGFAASAGFLALGALLAWRQKALPTTATAAAAGA